MARELRLEYEGAVYHVINQGNYRTPVFSEEGAKLAFLAFLGGPPEGVMICPLPSRLPEAFDAEKT